VLDLAHHPLKGFQVSFAGVRSNLTDLSGAAEMDLPASLEAGQQITIVLLAGIRAKEGWFLVDDQLTIPQPPFPARVALMKRSEMRAIADAALRVTARGGTRPGEITAERERVLVAEAARRGLSREQLETAINSFGRAADRKDRGIAASLRSEFREAEELLSKAAEEKKSDLADTLTYLGATQFAEGKYSAAAGSFRTALALRANDSDLLNGLGTALYKLAEWPEAERVARQALDQDLKRLGTAHPDVASDLTLLAAVLHDTNRLAEAEPLKRRALDIDEHSFGPQDPRVASDLGNLALLLQDTNRLSEAEPLMRRALDIDEHSFGPEHPDVAVRLNNLAALLGLTNRLAEAEPLMRRALNIDERALGSQHPEVAVRLNNLAELLRDTNRPAEAEPLIRRALAIDEQSLGPLHPYVARDLNNLATLLYDTNRRAEAEPLMRRALEIDEHSFGPQDPHVALRLTNLAALLYSTKRPTEAEPMMRRALDIDERSLGPQHPRVATDLSNLAQLLQATNRLADAEPLLLRALDIDEHSLGPQHPNVAIRLSNLARLLQATNRLAEAEPLRRRALGIYLAFARTQGHEHPNEAAALADYRALLHDLGKSEAEIDSAIDQLRTAAANGPEARSDDRWQRLSDLASDSEGAAHQRLSLGQAGILPWHLVLTLPLPVG
jgi:tetratricopeptide (TPR) repeat protein